MHYNRLWKRLDTRLKFYVIGLVWFDLFVRPFSHTCNTGHVNYKLQFIYYNTTYNIRTSIQYNIINKGKVFPLQARCSPEGR